MSRRVRFRQDHPEGVLIGEAMKAVIDPMDWAGAFGLGVNLSDVRVKAVEVRVEYVMDDNVECSVVEYDGSFKCTTHGRTWGAIFTKQTGPCPGWEGG